MWLFSLPAFIPWLIPIAIALVIIVWPFWAVFKAVRNCYKKPVTPYQPPKDDSPELLEAIRNGYSPAVPIGEIFPYSIDRQDIDKIARVRGVFFPARFQAGFYNTDDLPDLNPDDFKGLALRLYLEMAFIRSYLLENSPNQWSQRTEELWIYHTPRPLRKLKPDFYRQLLTKLKQATTENRPQEAA